jgi:hypothetical protein
MWWRGGNERQRTQLPPKKHPFRLRIDVVSISFSITALSFQIIIIVRVGQTNMKQRKKRQGKEKEKKKGEEKQTEKNDRA